MSEEYAILSPEDEKILAQKGLVRTSNQAGNVRLHRRFLNRSSDSDNQNIPIDVPENSPSEPVAFASIPRHLISPQTVVYVGFNTDRAREIIDIWETWPQDGPQRETDPDDGGLRVSFLDFLLGRVWNMQDAWGDNNEQWLECLERCGIAPSLKEAIMDPIFRDIRLSQSCIFWIKDTIRQRFAGLEEIQKQSKERVRAPLSSIGSGQISHPQSSATANPSQPRQSAQLSSVPYATAKALAASSAPGFTNLYKGIDEARVSGLFDSHGNISDITTLWSSPPSDFSASSAMFYFSPDRKVAEYYAAYARRRAQCEAVVIVYMKIPNSAIESLQEPQIRRFYWPSEDWKRIIWCCRTRRRLPPDLRNIRQATLIIGHIAKGPDNVYHQLNLHANITNRHLLTLDGSLSVQYAFSASEEGEDFILTNGASTLQCFSFSNSDVVDLMAEQ